ncbi:patatin-like phospholipase family protein [Myxococcus sp. XM-1-1-1]|uniref:patatin-like phospholipase family protein n=1 Tax=Myxococcus sp. XM-1-1-1 TaxID=2874602 RepID=UPI001CBB6E46|nr:patatin-like phospholipase family protein [Myxococcus sp. XM-1-1-1]MBZ4411038.1 patatin-like phospholipase family protein [Myxococcus sp. XM-1-1-1]
MGSAVPGTPGCVSSNDVTAAPRPSRSTTALVLAGLCLLGGAPAKAQPIPLDESGVPATAVSLTVSGGVSLGVYEAGFLYYALASAQGSQEVDLRLLTGASAGSLNSLLAVMASCGAELPPPDQSLFWRTWVPVGFNQLFIPASTSPLGVFSREWLERGAADIEKAWNQGLSTSCDVVFGVSTTRVEPRVLMAANGRMPLPRIEEKFAIRIRGRGPGKPPSATNYTTPGSRRMEPLLVTDEQGEIGFQALRDLILASMSFPVAFPPHELSTCVAKESQSPAVCLPREARTERYIDGGIFDNAPLRLAVGLARDGLHSVDGRLQWRDVPTPGVRQTPKGIAFAFVDPDATEYPVLPPAQARATSRSLPTELSGIIAALVDTARSKELSLLLEEEPDIARRLVLPRRHFPAASAPLFAFLGFFETEFRTFDFYLGMYDARRMLLDVTKGEDPFARPRDEPAQDPGSWAPFICMRAVYDGAAEAPRVCEGEALSDFRALLQVSLDQLYDACASAGTGNMEATWRNLHCERAMAGEPPPRVPGVSPEQWPDWRKSPKEPELDYSMRLLGAYGFSFRDLGVPRGRGDLAIVRIRQSLGAAVNRLTEVQSGDDRQMVSFAGKLAADTVAFAAPGTVLHVTMGPVQSEVGVSISAFEEQLPTGLRFTAALGFRGLEDVLSSGTEESFALAPVGGLEFRPSTDQSFLAQSRFSLRAGWMFSANDRYGTQGCEGRGASRVTACTRAVVQALVGVAILERFRVQLIGEWYPGSRSRETLWSVAPGIGVELGL